MPKQFQTFCEVPARVNAFLYYDWNVRLSVSQIA